MEYSIAELAIKLNKSKTSIYNKINANKKTFKPFLTYNNGSKYLSEDGYKVLLSTYIQGEVENEVEHKLKVNPVTTDTKDIYELHSILKRESQIGLLKLKHKLKQKPEKTVPEYNYGLNTALKYESQIELLKIQIECQNKDVEHLRAELANKNEQIQTLTRLLENSQVLLRESQQKLLSEPEPKKKSFWNWFKN